MIQEKDLVILMAWHNESCEDKIMAFEANKQSFQRYNPDVTIEVVINPYQNSTEAWLSTDRSIFSWYIENKVIVAKRYLIVEWDCWCDCILEQYYSKVWDCDLVVPNVKYPEIDDWYWFSEIGKLPLYAREHATGITPFCGILISNKAMDLIANEIFKCEFNDLNSEMRFATIATMVNIDPIVNPVTNRTLGWRSPFYLDHKYKGLHHPRKNIKADQKQTPGTVHIDMI